MKWEILNDLKDAINETKNNIAIAYFHYRNSSCEASKKIYLIKWFKLRKQLDRYLSDYKMLSHYTKKDCRKATPKI